MNAVDREPNSPSAPVEGRERKRLSFFGPGEPHPYRGPFTRWPRTSDAVLALTVFAVSLIAVTASALDDGEDLTLAAIGERGIWALALLALAATTLLWRRRHPIMSTAFLLAVMVVWAVLGYGDGQDLALIVAIYSVGRYAANNLRSIVTVAAVVTLSIVGSVVDTNQRVDVVPAVLFIGLPWYVGRRVRNRGDYLSLLRERAERLEAEQHARARQAVAGERSRIARELHDVVAHQVSMMTVQAGAARTIARDDLDAAIEAMEDVELAGRQALGELRHLLGVLRPETAADADLGPQPGLADIAALTDNLVHTGAEVTLTMADLPSALPAAVDLSAYRIVQESLTNIIKHAGPNPTVSITIGVDDRGIDIDITNTTDTASPDLPGSGFGIVGMSERAQLLGGTLTAEPRPTGHFCVRVHLPLDPERMNS